jgi:hypothetical protein
MDLVNNLPEEELTDLLIDIQWVQALTVLMHPDLIEVLCAP